MEPIDLKELLNGDSKAVATLKQRASTLGFTFVKLDSSITSIVEELLPSINSFFSNEKTFKEEFATQNIFGYQSVAHKESFRLLTQKRLLQFKIPKGLESLEELLFVMDKVMLKLCKVISHELFGKSITQLGDEGDLPLLKETRNPFGMFDIARYFNDGTHRPTQEPDLNCASHYDPGLISLNILQTYPGLQLQDPATGNWIDSPYDSSKGTSGDIGVIWFGKAASDLSNSFVKPGIHRVTYPENPGVPRITMWYEVCTTAQLHEGYDDEKPSEKDEQLEIPNIFPTLTPTMTNNKLEKVEHDYGVASSKVLYVPDIEKPLQEEKKSWFSWLPFWKKKGQTKNQALQSLESDYGVPMSKSGL